MPLIEKYEREFSAIDRRASAVPTMFHEEESVFKTVLPRVTHWSVAWSDLMMTMFILFLSMFVYQAAHKDFLFTEELGVLGGTTTEALDVETDDRGAYPFKPVKPGLPLMTGGTIKGAETVDVDELDDAFLGLDAAEAKKQIEQGVQERADRDITKKIENEVARFDSSVIKPQQPVEYVEPADTRTPQAIDMEQPFFKSGLHSQLFAASQQTLIDNNLEKFAAIKFAPDNTVRITLTGDLLFTSGNADLQRGAMLPLSKIGSVIKETPYMINVVGHTDNVPMHSKNFDSNWELSVHRAAAVARFFIEDMKMSPNQFVVSGYSSYRPVAPNNNTRNRAANRRVEVIVSKRVPVSVQQQENVR